MKSFFRRTYKDERGQMLPIIAFMMITFLGLTGLVIDAGHAYFAYRLLLNSTNAAAMAGAQGLPLSGTQALSNAKAYSSQSGGSNNYSNLNVTNATYKLGCVTASVGSAIPCVSTGSGTNTANAIQVTQTASVPTSFMRLFGYTSINVSATGTALMRGAGPKAYNLAVVMDATFSMNTADSNCNNISRFQCALNGVQTLLTTVSPCSSSGCGSLGSDGNYTNAIDRVSLFQFPEPSSSTQAAYAYDCNSSTNPSIVPYTYPSATGTSYSPAAGTPTYQITPFVSNYQSLSSGAPSGSLNTSTGSSGSAVAKAVGFSGCGAMGAPGGEGTYYAGVIYAAMGALLAQQAAEKSANQTVQNALIIVSDGAATSRQSQMSSSGVNSTGTYPSYNKECAQAVTAAQAANSAGITVYSVAYGSDTSGCTTDTGTYSSPCATMKAMASNVNTTFYSDAGANSNGCSSSNNPSSLGAIFQSIGGQLTAARLIPNSVFPSS